MMEKHTGAIHTFGPLVARILIGGMFLMAGIAKIFTFAGTAGFIGSVGLPFPEILALLAIIFEIAGGLSLILGYKIRYGADVLIVFTIVATAFFHNELSDQTQMIMFQKNLAIVGGLIYIYIHGAGHFAIDKES